MAETVFSFLDGGVTSSGAWIGVIVVICVFAIPYGILTAPLFLLLDDHDRNGWLAFTPFIGSLLLIGFPKRSLEKATTVGLAILGVLICGVTHFALFAWSWSSRPSWIAPDTGLLNAYMDGNLEAIAILLGGQPLLWPTYESVIAESAFFAILALPFVHWFLFGGWGWTRVARATGQSSRLRWFAAIPVIGVIGQWMIAVRLR